MEVSASRQDGGVDAGAQAVAELRRGSAAHRGLRAATAKGCARPRCWARPMGPCSRGDGQRGISVDNDGGHPLGALAAATVAGAAGRARISERAYNHPMRTARGHHRAASGVAGRPWARDLRFRDDLGVTDNGT